MPPDPRIARSLNSYVTLPSMASGYDALHRNTELFTFDTVFIKERLPAEGLVLDIGCGTGRHLVALSTPRRRVVGMDLSEHMLDIAAVKTERRGANANLVRADMRAGLPFRDASFDAVICMFSTIGLIPSHVERVQFLHDVARVLKPGGLFVFHAHNRFYNIFYPWGLAWLLRTYTWDRLFGGLEPGDRIMPHYGEIEGMYLHIFSPREVRKLVRDGGMELKDMYYLNDERTGEIRGFLRAVRANGFLLAARRSGSGAVTREQG